MVRDQVVVIPNETLYATISSSGDASAKSLIGLGQELKQQNHAYIATMSSTPGSVSTSENELVSEQHTFRLTDNGNRHEDNLC